MKITLRLFALILLAVATVAAVAVTELGPSPGHNKFRFAVEAMTFVSGAAALAATGGTRRLRPVWLVAALLGVLALAVLTAPFLNTLRVGLLADRLPGQERGFVLATLGRPDLVDNGIGIASVYAYRTATIGTVLVVRFSRSTDVDDKVQQSVIMADPRARADFGLYPP